MKDLVGKPESKIKPLLRKPLKVSGRTHITTLFPIMQKSHAQLAVVRDQKRRQIGIVTLEDILEELVGEIYDEYFDAKYGKRKTVKRAKKNNRSVYYKR